MSDEPEVILDDSEPAVLNRSAEGKKQTPNRFGLIVQTSYQRGTLYGWHDARTDTLEIVSDDRAAVLAFICKRNKAAKPLPKDGRFNV